LLPLVAALAGCYSPNRAEQAEQLERLIRAQLPDSLDQHFADDGHGRYALGSIQCLHDNDGRFNCVAVASRSYSADVSRSSPARRVDTSVLEGTLLTISGSCVEQQCSWRITK
jgi:hypothetical protein